MLTSLALIVGLFAWGSHAVVPWRLANAPEGARRAWSLAASQLLLLAMILGLLRIRADPDPALAQRLQPGSPFVLVCILVVALLFAVDIVLALGQSRLRLRGWQVAGAVGVAALVPLALAGERLRIGLGPEGAAPSLLVAASIRVLVALGAGETLAPGRPRLAPWAGCLLPLYLWVLPAPLRSSLAGTGLVWTAVAGGGLFFAGRWLPPRWRRPALLAATVIAGLLLARIAELSSQLEPASAPALVVP